MGFSGLGATSFDVTLVMKVEFERGYASEQRCVGAVAVIASPELRTVLVANSRHYRHINHFTGTCFGEGALENVNARLLVAVVGLEGDDVWLHV